MRIRIYFLSMLLAVMTALSFNPLPALGEDDSPVFVFAAGLAKEQIVAQLTRMISLSGFLLETSRPDRVVFRKRSVPHFFPYVASSLYYRLHHEEWIAVELSEIGNQVGLAFTASRLTAANTPDEQKSDVTEQRRPWFIQVLEIVQAQLEGSDVNAVLPAICRDLHLRLREPLCRLGS